VPSALRLARNWEFIVTHSHCRARQAPRVRLHGRFTCPGKSSLRLDAGGPHTERAPSKLCVAFLTELACRFDRMAH
jgi:hypothetical protein